MAYFRCGTGGGIPSSLTTDMNAVLNKKFGTSSQDYPYTDWASDVNLMGLLPEKTASGAIASFTDGADDVPVKEAVFDITAVQAGTGDPTPSNVRAISGYTGMNVTKAGKNLFDGITILPYSGSFTSYYAEFSVNSTARKIPSVTLEEGKTYVLEIDITSDTEPFNISIGAGSGSYSRDVYTETGLSNGKHSISFTPTSTDLSSGAIMAIRAPRYSSSASRTFSVTSMMVYEASNRTVIPVSWQTEAGTVYGGSLNLTTGILTVNKQIVVCDGSDDEGWTLLADSSYKYFAPVIAPNTNEIAETSNYMANKYIFRGMGGTTTSTVTDDKSVYMQASYGRVWIYDSEITSVANLKTSLLSQPLQVVYPLATPQTYQLTPHQMNTLLGNNNIWADTGDASVTYRADISLALTWQLIGGTFHDN